MRALCLLLLALAVCLCTRPLAAQTPAGPAINRLEGDTIYLEQQAEAPPVIDGNLDDPCWQTALRLGDFIQTSPVQGARPTFPTEVLLCRGPRYLYLAFRCLDDNPSKICAFQTRPDAWFEDRDDQVSVFIDSFHDNRRCYEFSTNPCGAKLDIKWYNVEWDGIWDVAARIHDWGWAVEYAIDLGCLSYPSGAQEVGLNFLRIVQRLRDRSAWRYVVGERTWDQRCWGHLRGFAFDKLAGPPRPQAKVYALGTLERSEGETHLGASEGLDLRYDFQSNVQANLALNPDFSDVEGVYQSVDQSYTERELEETRPFFTEGSEFFDSRFFYSRRIPDFDYGAKAYGKLSGTSFGLLATRYELESRSDVVAAVTQDIGDVNYATVGMAGKAQPGDHNFVVGGAGAWEALRHPRIRLNGQYLSARSQTEGTDSSLYLDCSARTTDDVWSLSMEYEDTGPNFNPADGYVPDTDVRGLSTRLHCHFPPSQTRKRFLSGQAGVSYDHADHQDGRPLRESTRLNFSTQYSERLDLNLSHEWGRRAVDIHEQEIIYADRRNSLRLSLNPLERLSYECGLIWGRVQDASYSLLTAGANFASADNLWGARLSLEQRFHHSAEEGNATAMDASVSYALSPNAWLAVRNYLLREGGVTNDNFSAVGRFLWPSGRELVVVIGDPRADRTATRLTLKYLLPLR
jgi:hypothetical protein